MIAVDAPILVELLADGRRADAVEASLRQALVAGRVVVCDAALAQVCAALRNGVEALATLEGMGVHYSATEAKSALRAGEMQRRQRQRGEAPRPIADFLVGAHALLQCDALITFDATFHRDYFKGLKLIVPTLLADSR
ncbi:type II toxin-antitoxin system VapC family toxin [Dokdonella sp.]|uniref:type II toxin-antitoxin system VapC family toxin n=1 Tax=Dokdonella sp. TaxID=2291710 RepID=UPI0025B9E51F|nr:type II toxin-antitoxin system VapC family toxin [Dokdonella sp.]MBX3693221.1 type II toxin-antitoxin system VapC family toxin [Dokdonella sp.]